MSSELDTVVLSAEGIRVHVVPGQGCDIVSLIDVRTAVDVLYRTPWARREPAVLPPYGSRAADWLARYRGGWQVIAPNSGDDVVIPGSPQGFQGEASMVPWEVLNSGPSMLHARVPLLTAPFTIERTMQVAGGTLRLEESVTNTSGERIPFHWIHHPAFGAPFLGAGTRFELDAASIVTDPGRGALRRDAVLPWPIAPGLDGGTLDLSRMPGPDDTPREVFGTLVDFRTGRYRIVNDDLDLAVTVTWDLETFPFAWFWQEVHASSGYPFFGRGYVTAIEPASLIPGHGPIGHHERGGLLWLGPDETRSTTLTATVSRGTAT